MTDSPAAQPAGKPPKQMSSRLLTMKFMQRAAASRPDSPATPSKSSPSGASMDTSPREDTASSFKRQKVFHAPDTPGSVEFFTPTRPADIRAALASAESARQAALERSWRGEETKWAFAIQPDSVLPEAGFKVELLNGRRLGDDEEDDDLRWRPEEMQGRKVFGKKREHIPSKEHTNDEDESDDSDSSVDSEASLIRQTEEILNAPDTGFPTRGSAIRSNRISGPVNMDRIQCHGCKEYGHMIRNCPSKDTRKHYQSTGVRQRG